MAASKAQLQTAARLRKEGFNKSRVSDTPRYVRVGCDQCQAMVVNNVAIHEAGCPNERRSRRNDDDEYDTD